MLAASPFYLMNLAVLTGEPAHPWWDYPGLEFWKFLNLIIFVAAMVYLVRKPLTSALQTRREGIRRELQKAKEERDQALAKLAEVDARLARLDKEVAGIAEKAQAEALAERERIKRETEAEMLKLREQTQRDIEGAGKVARHELQRFAAQQSVKLAEEILRRDLRPEDDARLIRLNVEEIGEEPKLSLQTIARRYALALADVVLERGEALPVQEELLAWGAMIQSSPLLQEAFGNPTVQYDQKQKVLSELIARTKVRPTTANFLQTLLKNQRLTELGEVNRKFAQVLDERSGVVAAAVTTAHPVAEESQTALRKKLNQLTGKSVRLTFTTDSELIGGMVTRIGSTVYDGSVRNQLREAEQRLAGD